MGSRFGSGRLPVRMVIQDPQAAQVAEKCSQRPGGPCSPVPGVFRTPPRTLLDPDEPPAPPTDAQQPSPRSRHRRTPREDGSLSPAVEPRSGGAGIDSRESQAVMPGVLEDVDERRPDLARRAQRSRVEAVGEHAPSPLPEAVESPCHTHGEALHAAGEPSPVVGLDDQMDVVRLQRVLVHPEPEAVASVLEDAQHPLPDEMAAQARQPLSQSQRHVERVAAVVAGTLDMGDSCACGRALASCSPARTAPGSEGQLVLSDASASVHLAIGFLEVSSSHAVDHVCDPALAIHDSTCDPK